MRGTGRGRGKSRVRPTRQIEEPVPEEEPANLVAEMRGVHQTLNTLVGLQVQWRKGEPQPHDEPTPPVRGHHQPHVGGSAD